MHPYGCVHSVDFSSARVSCGTFTSWMKAEVHALFFYQYILTCLLNPKTQNGGSKMQTIKIILTTLFLIGINCLNGYAQSKIDYSIKSNILDPDTLKGDRKLVFDHFVKWTHKQVKELKTLELKEEFKKIGLYTKENDRFLKAYFFLRSDITYHKKSVEQWENFKDLDPRKK